MKKLRIYFILFFVLLSVSIGFLLKRAYSSLQRDAFLFYRKTAESLSADIRDRLFEALRKEEDRSYAEYRYVHVTGDDDRWQQVLNLSPLSRYPVRSDFPGIIGYFQIDPDQSFHTPLLPDSNDERWNRVPDLNDRKTVRDQIEQIVAKDLLRKEGPLPSVASQKEANVTKGRIVIDRKLEQDYYTDNLRSDYSSASPLGRGEGDGPVFKRKIQKSSPQQAMVFESNLQRQNEDPLLNEEDSKKPQAQKPKKQRELARGAVRGLFMDAPISIEEKEAEQGKELNAEVDPFQAKVVDGRWLLFYRKVWRQNRRYVQGFMANFSDFMDHIATRPLQNSALVTDSSFLVFDGDDLLYQPKAKGSDGTKAYLLYRTEMAPPLSKLSIAFTTNLLPQHPSFQLLHVFSATLGLVLIGGLFGIYRTVSAQMDLSQKKSDFVSAVSHELKTPLTSIRMYGEMLMEGWHKNDEKRDSYLRYIHDESERLSRLIENVLQLARLEKKDWRIQVSPVDPVALVKNVAESVEGHIGRSGFTLDTQFQDIKGNILVDPDALTQVLINLIDNSIKFSKEAEEKKIILTVVPFGWECWISVRDFGPGIPKNKMKRIFERFYRVDQEMTRTARGTGIGLALVKTLAEAMDAKVDVANREPGAEFTIKLDVV